MVKSAPPKTRRALLSVSEKKGLLELAKALSEAGYELLSTGGTFKALQDGGVEATKIEDVTKTPEAFGGRLKTLHPMIAGGILLRRDNPQDQKEAAALGIVPIDIVIVNLYPFEKTVNDLGITTEKILPQEAIEQIDIGGPTLLRSAAKNFSDVTVVCDPSDYPRVIDSLKLSSADTLDFRRELAGKVFTHTAAYDALIAKHITSGLTDGIVLTDVKTLRYGENPHQWGKFASFYGSGEPKWKKLRARI